MTTVVLLIDKAKVYEEVAQTTAYTGAKMDGDEKAYERISTIDGDQSQLERFWNESCVAVCETLKRYMQSETVTETTFTVTLGLSSAFDTTLQGSMAQELFSFFVMNITAKWYTFTNKKEAAEYGASALAFLEGVHRKACYKKKPVRPSFNS